MIKTWSKFEIDLISILIIFIHFLFKTGNLTGLDFFSNPDPNSSELVYGHRVEGSKLTRGHHLMMFTSVISSFPSSTDCAFLLQSEWWKTAQYVNSKHSKSPKTFMKTSVEILTSAEILTSLYTSDIYCTFYPSSVVLLDVSASPVSGLLHFSSPGSRVKGQMVSHQ